MARERGGLARQVLLSIWPAVAAMSTFLIPPGTFLLFMSILLGSLCAIYAVGTPLQNRPLWLKVFAATLNAIMALVAFTAQAGHMRQD